MKDYRIYWIWLAERAGQASTLAVKLVNHFGNASGVYAAGADDIDRECAEIFTAREIGKAKRILADKNTDTAERILEEAEKLGQRVVVPTDADFPRSLTSLRNAPLVLYVMGKLPSSRQELYVSVVGTRTMSDSGKRNAYAIGYGLGAGGAVVVSGMALGCDGMALCGAVNAGGKTIAVLGGGADVVYPKDHATLYNTIIQNGAVISEYPPGTRPAKHQFPQRNRIISGLSAGSVVVEAPEGSGALITARHAICQGRNVFAVPGDVGCEGSAGPNNLIKNGAYVATSAEDILSEYEFLYPHSVSLRAYHRAMRNFEPDISADEAMARLRVSVRGGRNYYGTSAYGGKSSSVGKAVEQKKAPKVKRGDKKNADQSISMGNMADYEVKVISRPDVADVAMPEVKVPSERENRIDLDLLEEVNIKVYNMMKPDVPMIPDELVCDGLSVSDVLSSLSMLELAGAIESHPGGYFLRASSDDLVLDSELS